MVNIDDKIDWIRFYTEHLQTVPKPAGDHKYNACCPFHHERNPSFWFNTTNGMWKCESGCGSGNATSFLARIDNIDTQDAWKQLLKIAGVSEEPETRQRQPETLQHYSESKHMPVDFLKSLGLKDRPGEGSRPDCVIIPYYNQDGSCVAMKQRYHPQNKQRFGWDKGGKPTLYGLWLDLNKNARSVILCEGESDAQSCWLNGLPCYGVPGATNFQKEWVSLIGDKNIYIHVEPDRGGQQFLIKTLQKLKEAEFTGKVYSFRCKRIDGESKDPSELLIRHGEEFRALIDPAIKAATQEDLDNIPVIYEAKDTAPGKKEVHPLEVYRASELYGLHLEAPPTIVRGMIPAGLTVLAGAPKKGKSWMSLALGIAVASGQPFLGMETEIGDVLYLDLESKKFRVQKRLEKLLVGPAPERLFISHACEKLDDGLMEQVQMWAAGAEHPVMVIIDTLGKVDGSRKKGENAYQSDTRILGTLQGFALDQKIAIVVVHHMRKSTATLVADPFELVSGSMGITGAADAVLLLTGKRGDEDTILSVTSRDFESKELVVTLDNGRWILKSTNSEEYMEEQKYMKSPYVRAIVHIAHQYHYWKGTSTDFMEALISAGCMEAGQNDIRKIVSEIVNSFQKKLYEREGVIFDPPRKGAKGKRYIEIKEVQKDGF